MLIKYYYYPIYLFPFVNFNNGKCYMSAKNTKSNKYTKSIAINFDQNELIYYYSNIFG